MINASKQSHVYTVTTTMHNKNISHVHYQKYLKMFNKAITFASS